MNRLVVSTAIAHVFRWLSFTQALGRLVQLALLTICLSAMSSKCYAEADSNRGEALYQESCKVCHSIDRNGIGPKHRGVFGRVAGSVADYSYSPALKNAHIIWNEETLDKWLEDSQAFLPENKMFFPVDDAQERRDLIAFLKQKAK
jgi:cytochrome c